MRFRTRNSIGCRDARSIEVECSNPEESGVDDSAALRPAIYDGGRQRSTQLTFKVGPVAYAAMLSAENTDVFSIALGGEVRFEFLRRQELHIVGRAAYAPDILTFGSADNLWDVTARAELPLTDRITGFVDYRQFEIDLLQGANELEESIHHGMRYQFR